MKKIISLLIAGVMLLSMVSPFTAEAETKFSDIEGHWAKENILRLVDLGVLKGYPNGKFGVSDHITREQLATIVVRAFNIKLDENAKSSYADVSDSRWSKKFVESTKSYLNITGDKFEPEKEVDREEIISALILASGLAKDYVAKGIDESKFVDVADVTKEQRVLLEVATNNHILNGIELNGKFYLKPKEKVTRAQVAKLVTNFEDYTDLTIGNANSKYDFEFSEQVQKLPVFINGKLYKNVDFQEVAGKYKLKAGFLENVLNITIEQDGYVDAETVLAQQNFNYKFVAKSDEDKTLSLAPFSNAIYIDKKVEYKINDTEQALKLAQEKCQAAFVKFKDYMKKETEKGAPVIESFEKDMKRIETDIQNLKLTGEISKYYEFNMNVYKVFVDRQTGDVYVNYSTGLGRYMKKIVDDNMDKLFMPLYYVG